MGHNLGCSSVTRNKNKTIPSVVVVKSVSFGCPGFDSGSSTHSHMNSDKYFNISELFIYVVGIKIHNIRVVSKIMIVCKVLKLVF